MLLQAHMRLPYLKHMIWLDCADMLPVFPPKTIKLKKPFAFPPWADSDENVGNLLMAWKFLQTFADILGLWPFSLDEFLQAFHDYDPRLLGEIHIAILKCIIKDIEDVARTPSTGLGSNQYSATIPGGGHPQIVEGAYAWGFDIKSWQRHLNPLTWPEILRQLALSAGFGPKLKKTNIESSHRDDQEGNNCEAIISKLRNGTAAENAVALMNEKGYSNSRRSRHRLTPGTVKFAAFHILSLEGSKGITILEVADKIQKSGLRDLTTSRTPEASIAAALSRDTTLFERTAPSTYCVRPTYRKDPADAEAILSAAREKIRLFKSGLPDAEEVDDVERDEDSDSDVAEDPEAEDLCNDPITKTDVQKDSKGVGLPSTSTLSNGNEAPIASGGTPEAFNDLSSTHSEVLNEGKHDFACFNETVNGLGRGDEASPPYLDDMDLDEGYSGEPWVQGLVTGEYSNLSVEERLHAVVALVGLAIEGNSIRLVLEERLEAANTLKKQMWAEAQVDKRRVRDDCVLKVHCPSSGGRSEVGTPNIATEAKRSPVASLNDHGNEILISQPDRCGDSHVNNSHYGNISSNPIQDSTFGPDNIQIQLSGYTYERSRSQLKSVIGQKAEDTYVYRSLPLGQDRRRNRYWQFITSVSTNEPGCSRIFVELRDGRWRLIDDKQDFDTLVASLDARGTREAHLYSMLQKVQTSFKGNINWKLHPDVGNLLKLECRESNSHPDADGPSSGVCLSNSDLETSSSFAIELGKNEDERSNALTRYQDFQKWVWSECFSSSNFCALRHGGKRATQLLGICEKCYDSYFFEDKHCPFCHGTFRYSDCSLGFADHVAQCEHNLQMEPYEIVYPSVSLPLRARLLKVMLALVEVSVPSEALHSVWTETQRLEWGAKLNNSVSSEDLLQVLTVLESIIPRDYLSPNFETTNEILGACKASDLDKGYGSIRLLPWIPKTTAAVALRLMELDTAIYYTQQLKLESEKEEAGNYMLPSKYDDSRKLQDVFTPTPYEIPNVLENRVDHGASQGGSSKRKRGNGNSGRTGSDRSQRKVSSSKSDTVHKTVPASNGPLGQMLGWKGAAVGGGRRQGRRTARTRHRPGKSVMEINNERSSLNFVPVKPLENAAGGSDRNEWNAEMQATENDVNDVGSSSSSEYDEDTGQAMVGEEYDNMAAVDDYPDVYNRQSQEFNEVSEDEYGDHGVEAEGEEDEQGDLDVGRYINEYSDEDEGEGNGDANAGVNYMLDDPAATGSSSSADYSD
uniref:Homeobox-DDT domain protein RLT1 n=1 Tax=Kalanchoe fedtschenkoi TaxID=63787 RepID=A0A7N0U4U5_KALFE